MSNSDANTSITITRCKYFDPCYARATVVRARFLAAAFSDGSYLAHVNGAYLVHDGDFEGVEQAVECNLRPLF